ncbi:MAG: hypothetical protein ACKOEC_21195 [Acidimicrobiia bacterium]
MTGQSIIASRAGCAKIDLDGCLIWADAGVPSLTADDSAGDAFGNSYLVHGQFVAGGGTVREKLDAPGAPVWRLAAFNGAGLTPVRRDSPAARAAASVSRPAAGRRSRSRLTPAPGSAITPTVRRCHRRVVPCA